MATDLTPDVIQAIRTQGARDAETGRFVKGHKVNYKHGARMQTVPELLTPYVDEREARMLAEKGGAENLTSSQQWTTRMAARWQIYAEVACLDVDRYGFKTSKDKTRAAVNRAKQIANQAQTLTQAYDAITTEPRALTGVARIVADTSEASS